MGSISWESGRKKLKNEKVRERSGNSRNRRVLKFHAEISTQKFHSSHMDPIHAKRVEVSHIWSPMYGVLCMESYAWSLMYWVSCIEYGCGWIWVMDLGGGEMCGFPLVLGGFWGADPPAPQLAGRRRDHLWTRCMGLFWPLVEPSSETLLGKKTKSVLFVFCCMCFFSLNNCVCFVLSIWTLMCPEIFICVTENKF